MQEYPKRIYKGGKGITVNSEEEERVVVSGKKVETITIPEDTRFVGMEDRENKEQEALKYIESKGYSKKAAKNILKQEGLEKILEARDTGREPQE